MTEPRSLPEPSADPARPGLRRWAPVAGWIAGVVLVLTGFLTRQQVCWNQHGTLPTCSTAVTPAGYALLVLGVVVLVASTVLRAALRPRPGPSAR